MILKIILLLFVILTALLSGFSFKIYKKYRKTKQDAAKIYLACKRLRYGDIHTRVGNLNDKAAEAAVNRLFETISDREFMVKEYQNTLSQKNLLLEKSIKQEQEMKKVKDDFAAALTHDMKVPVIAELNSIDYLLSGRFGSINEKQTEILKLMQSSIKELKELIENMLEVYKLEQTALKLNLQTVNLNNFLSDAVSEMRPIALEKNIKINCFTDKTSGIKLKFDPFQAKRALKNLMQNAVSFSPENENITIKTETSPDETKIAVINKSTGLIKEDLDLIFNKYYCGHSKFRKTGTGLGLYITKQIMLAHKGNIEVSAAQDGAASFVLVFKN